MKEKEPKNSQIKSRDIAIEKITFFNFLIRKNKELNNYEIYDVQLRKFTSGKILECTAENKDYRITFLIIQDNRSFRTIIKMINTEPRFPFSEFIKSKGPLYQISPVFNNFLYHPLNFIHVNKGEIHEKTVEELKEIQPEILQEWKKLDIKFFKYKLVIKNRESSFLNKITALIPKQEPLKTIPVFIGEKIIPLLNL